MAKGKTGKRYTDAQKKRILAFIDAKGRGGLRMAKEKWGVAYISIRGWRKPKGKSKTLNRRLKASGRNAENVKIVKSLFSRFSKDFKKLSTLVGGL